MKTNLMILPIKNEAQATRFIFDLVENQELFHFEDDIAIIEFNATEINESERFLLKEIVRQIYELEDYDPLKIAYECVKDKELEETRNEALNFLFNIATKDEVKEFISKIIMKLSFKQLIEPFKNVYK